MNGTRVYFDLETAGLEEDAPIIQLAAAAYIDGKHVDSFEAKIQFDESEADPEALAMNHYSREEWDLHALPPVVVATKFARFLDRYKTVPKVSKKSGRPYKVAQLAGYNCANFDAPRLQRFFEKLGVFLPADYKTRDVFQLVLWFFEAGPEPESHKLGPVCEFFGIKLEKAHDALSDVLGTAELGEYLLSLMPAGVPACQG